MFQYFFKVSAVFFIFIIIIIIIIIDHTWSFSFASCYFIRV